MSNNKTFLRNSVIIWSLVLIIAVGAFTAAALMKCSGGISGTGKAGWFFSVFPFNISLGSADRSEFVELKSETVSGSINEVSLDWISGEVHIQKSKNSETRIVQKGMEGYPEDDLFELKEGSGKIDIDDGRRNKVWFGFSTNRNAEISDLYVYLPEKVYDMVRISCVSSSIDAADLKAAEIDFDTVSGDMALSGSFTNIAVSTVSGRIDARDVDVRKAKFASTSGNILSSGSFTELDVNTVSGDVDIKSDRMLEEMKMHSVSGLLKITIPENEGFIVNFSKVSGSMESDFAFAVSGNRYTYKGGSGAPVFSVSTVSGNLVIRKK